MNGCTTLEPTDQSQHHKKRYYVPLDRCVKHTILLMKCSCQKLESVSVQASRFNKSLQVI